MQCIEFFGAVNTVTGSKFIITSDDKKVLIDCGMYQGNRDEAYLKNQHFNENTPDVNACILSHAHIDHSGMLPSLVKQGYTGKIYSTPATKDLCKYMLKDSVTVFTKDLGVIKKMLKKKRIHEQVYPLYEVEDVERCMGRFVKVDYDTPKQISDSISFSFHDSCHILGSASVKIIVDKYNIKNKIWYTSDLGHDHSFLCNEPKMPLDINYLVIESTYGNKKRQEEDIQQMLITHINDAYKRGGKVLIPAFSVGRMQTVLLILHKLSLMNLIPNIPIYIDSPLGNNVTHLYEKYSDEINQDTIHYFTDAGLDPFNAPFIHYVTEMADSERIAKEDERSIIISASGMCEGGHVRNHIKEISGDKNSSIVFVGYNAEGTLGRRLQDTSGTVNIDGSNYRVRCKVETINGLSAHADLNYLINYVENCVAHNPLKKIFLVHGDPDAIKNVKQVLNEKGITNVVIPELGKQYKL